MESSTTDLYAPPDRTDPRARGIWSPDVKDPLKDNLHVSKPEGWWNSKMIANFPKRSVSLFTRIRLHLLTQKQYDEHQEHVATLIGHITRELEACRELEERINDQLEIAKAQVGELHRLCALKNSVK